MHFSNTRKWRTRVAACASMFVLSILGLGSSARAQSDPDNPVDAIPTATPIKHVIIIVGENRSFEHLFAAYVPKKKNDKILNLCPKES